MALTKVRRSPPKLKGTVAPRTPLALILRLDRRGRDGRALAAVEASLLEHLGSDASAAQRLIATLAAVEAMKVAALTSQMLSELGETQCASEAWHRASAGLKRSLQLLGVERPAVETPSLARYLEVKGAVDE